MKEALAKLEKEVQELHKEEQGKLEEEKKKALDRLQRLVSYWYTVVIPTFLDRQVWANSVDPWRNCLIRVYTVCQCLNFLEASF